jgi:hypothetical protein
LAGHVVGLGARNFGKAFLNCRQIVQPLESGFVRIARRHDDDCFGMNEKP